MIRPFGLRDSLRLYQLARRSTPLHLEYHLLQRRSPLWTAVGTPLPWHGTGAATFLHLPNGSTGDGSGFVQAIKRHDRPEGDVTCIAPALDISAAAADIWLALLEHIVSDAGHHGIQRLYLCLKSDDPVLPLCHRAGFAPYIQETLFQRPAGASAATGVDGDASHLRPQREQDGFALQRLSNAFTPPLVQQAEGTLVKNGDSSSPLDPRFWWQPHSVRGFVYEARGSVQAAAFIRRGHLGHWLRLLGDPNDIDPAAALLHHCAISLERLSAHPLYCALRPYQSSFGPLLRELGFVPGPTLTRLVKHTTSRVKKAAPVPARDMAEATLHGLLSPETRLDPPQRSSAYRR